jgi:hypothetical protein
MAGTQISSFGKIATRSKIDKLGGIIYGVSVITAGPAIGHDVIIDSVTLDQVKSVASAFPDGIKVRLNHPAEGKSAAIQSIAAALKNFHIDGTQVRADLHLLKSDSNFDKILELAETQPENFGLSLHFSGVPEQSDDLKLARCTEIYACDLVDAPAANPTGLFSKKEQTMSKTVKYAEGDSGPHSSECECAECCKMGKKDERMSAMLSALGLGDNATPKEITNKITAMLQKPAAAAAPDSLTVKLDDGTIATLSGKEIAMQLQASAKLVKESNERLNKAEKDALISKMDSQGRVPFNPEKNVAYTLQELQALPVETLKVLAVNAPVLPLQAKSIFRGDSTPKIDATVKGSQRTIMALENNGYSSLAVMKARHNLN